MYSCTSNSANKCEHRAKCDPPRCPFFPVCCVSLFPDGFWLTEARPRIVTDMRPDFDRFWLIWPIFCGFWLILTDFGGYWTDFWWILTNYGGFWPITVDFVRFWWILTDFDRFCGFWPILVGIEPILVVFDNFGRFWLILVDFDWLWPILVDFDPYWPILTDFDRFWLILNDFARTAPTFNVKDSWFLNLHLLKCCYHLHDIDSSSSLHRIMLPERWKKPFERVDVTGKFLMKIHH